MNKPCLDIAKDAAKGRLTDQEIMDAFDREGKIREAILNSGKTDNLDARVAQAIIREATAAKVDAAMKRKQAALNIKARERLNAHISTLKSQGLKPRQAILATMEGTQRGVEGGRVSAARQTLAYDGVFVGDMMARVQREKPHIISLLGDKNFDNAVTDELFELREGGTPGKTKNKDAQYFAKVLAAGLEESRTRANEFGGNIGKLDGYSGPQVHDDLAMMKAGSAKWVADIKPMLDLGRTFPDVSSEAELDKVLGDIYQTIISGISNKPSASLTGQRVGPANLANRLGRHRVLHFSDSQAARQYRDLYGRGSTIGLIFAHQRNMARTVAAMETFGPNPEVMVKSIVAREEQALKAQLGGKNDKKILKQLEALNEAKFQAAIDQVTGMSQVPVSAGSANLHSNIRSGISMAKLGGAVLTAIPTDLVTAASASMFRGGGFWKGLFNSLGATFNNMGSAKAKEMSYLLGEGFDGLTGHIANAAAANDGPPGAISKAAHTFFKYSGLSGWTDAARGASARIISAHLGVNLGKGFDKLDPRFQHVLNLNGIDAAKWNVLRQAGYKELNGNRYLTPDRVRSLTDEQIAPLVGMTAKTADEARRALEMDLRGYIADETTYAVVETDPASRRISTLGTRPGTFVGEAIRYVMQFKGFPTAFTQRILGRAALGGPGRTMGERLMNNAPHVGALIAGMTTAGYMSLVLKDSARGAWPPRDPFSPKTWGAALVQGGGLGIYGDFLFGEANRFGQSPLATVGGPAVGVGEDMAKLFWAARDGDAKAAQALNLAINNTPYINLFYARPVLDVLFLNSLREAASPGYLARQRTNRQRDYGQSYVLPRTLNELVH